MIIRGNSLTINNKGLLITGQSGVGKTTLCEELINILNGKWISDDYSQVTNIEQNLLLSAPFPIQNYHEKHNRIIAHISSSHCSLNGIISIKKSRYYSVAKNQTMKSFLGKDIPCIHIFRDDMIKMKRITSFVENLNHV